MKGLLLTINLYTVAGSIWVRLLFVGDGRKGKSQFRSPSIFRAASTPNSFRGVVLWTVARDTFFQLVAYLVLLVEVITSPGWIEVDKPRNFSQLKWLTNLWQKQTIKYLTQ